MPANRRRQSAQPKQKAKTKKELEAEIERLKGVISIRENVIAGIVSKLSAATKKMEDDAFAKLQKSNPLAQRSDTVAMVPLHMVSEILSHMNDGLNSLS